MKCNFDYETFATKLKVQAKCIMPEDITPEDSAYIENKLYDFSLLAGKTLVSDKSLNFSKEQLEFAVQIIAEWTFHKSIDLIKAGIPKEIREKILPKICFVIFEILKQNIDMERQELLETIEANVNKTYIAELKASYANKEISKQIREDALCQSNIDRMANESVENENTPDEKNDKISVNDFEADKISTPEKKSNQISISNISENIKNFLSTCFCPQKNLTKLNNELEDIYQEMRELVNPDKKFERLGVDVLCLQIGCNLLSITDPDVDNGGKPNILSCIAAVRDELTDTLGYIIPHCRIMDCSELEQNEYIISVRNNVVARGYVYPDKYMVLADDWDKTGKPISEDTIIGINPTDQVQAYWIPEADAQLAEDEDIALTLPVMVIKHHFKSVVIKYVDQILTTAWVYKYLDHIKEMEEMEYGEKIINSLLEKIDIDDIRNIFVNLIQEKVSIKDIMFVLERLCDYARFSKEPDILSERLRAALGRQICLSNVNKDHVLYALMLSPKWEKILDGSCQKTEHDTTFFKLEQEQVHDLIESTAMTLMKARQSIGQQPVILCPPRIRLPLFQLLEKHIPVIVVISYSELVKDIIIENVDTIE